MRPGQCDFSFIANINVACPVLHTCQRYNKKICKNQARIFTVPTQVSGVDAVNQIKIVSSNTRAWHHLFFQLKIAFFGTLNYAYICYVSMEDKLC